MLTALLFNGACPTAAVEVGTCQDDRDCPNDAVCRASFCQKTCNYNRDCQADQHCENGACAPGAFVLPDAGRTDAESLDRSLSDRTAPERHGADLQQADAAGADRALADRPLPDAAQGDAQTAQDAAFSTDATQSCPLGQHDGGDGTCVSLNECVAGFHDGGDGACWPAGVCVDGFHDAGDGRCFPAGYCAAGYHDDGLGDCVAESQCAAGFHDGGDGSCVSEGSCLSGFHDGGDGSCLGDGICAEGYHDGGNGDCVSVGSCATGYHDGGDAVCVAVGSCSDGYHDGGDGDCVIMGACSPDCSLYYIDGDGDGFGAGELSEDCVHLPPSPHLSTVDGDCNDNDPAVHSRATYYPDLDHDGYTGAAEHLCKTSAPSGYQEQPTPAPYVSFAASSFVSLAGSGGDVEWHSQGYAYLRDAHGSATGMRFTSNDHISDEFVATGFDLDLAADANITGLRVHVLRRAAGGDDVWDQQVRLYHNGVLGDNRALSAHWPDTDYEEQVYGGATDLWGLAWTPALLNDANFGLVVQANLAGGSGLFPFLDTGYIDNVWIEVFVDGVQHPDCDDDDGGVWSSRVMLTDSDGDGYGAGSAQIYCVGELVPDGLAPASVPDCYSGSADAHPWQYSYFEVDRGDGSFDYDCDGSLTKGYISKDTECTWDTDSSTCKVKTSASFDNKAPCGQNNRVPRCSGDNIYVCGLHDVDVTTACR